MRRNCHRRDDRPATTLSHRLGYGEPAGGGDLSDHLEFSLVHPRVGTQSGWIPGPVRAARAVPTERYCSAWGGHLVPCRGAATAFQAAQPRIIVMAQAFVFDA